jgi:hypothetical protein
MRATAIRALQLRDNRLMNELLIALLLAGTAPEAESMAAAGPPAATVAPATASLDPANAARYAQLALACVDRPWPYKSERVLASAEAVRPPRADHPVFFGCFDWHSAAHGHWLLVRLARLYPDQPFAAEARAALAARFTAERFAGEVAFFQEPDQKLFERPYGWAWLLRLALELRTWDDPQAQAWAQQVAPLERAIVERLSAYLPKLSYPVRSGVHPNTAFALGFALDYARAAGDANLERLAVERSRAYYLADAACPVTYEPSGEDFFSPCLLEADLMRRVLPPAEFSAWLDRFLPGLRSGAAGGLGNLEHPAQVTDPTDGKIVHLDGLNLVRAWTMRGIASALPAADPRRARLLKLADAHAASGLARVASGHYEGEHWLASFAVYLLTVPG